MNRETAASGLTGGIEAFDFAEGGDGGDEVGRVAAGLELALQWRQGGLGLGEQGLLRGDVGVGGLAERVLAAKRVQHPALRGDGLHHRPVRFPVREVGDDHESVDAVPRAQLKERVTALCNVLLAKNPAALRACKQACRRVGADARSVLRRAVEG